jgi:hypothetical protein
VSDALAVVCLPEAAAAAAEVVGKQGVLCLWRAATATAVRTAGSLAGDLQCGSAYRCIPSAQAVLPACLLVRPVLCGVVRVWLIVRCSFFALCVLSAVQDVYRYILKDTGGFQLSYDKYV